MIPAVEQRVSLVTLGVKDLTRARAFYETLEVAHNLHWTLAPDGSVRLPSST